MSWIEVESKIKINNPEETRKKIKKVAEFVKIEKKIDDYFSLEKGVYPKKSLRVRDKGNKVEVNFKKWVSYNDGVHMKKESEFEVSDLKNFFSLLVDFGFERWIRKEKRTELYKTKDKVSIELNYVKKLGWYVEIEILCKERDMKKAKKRIIEIRKALRLDKNVEKEGYTKILWKKR